MLSRAKVSRPLLLQPKPPPVCVLGASKPDSADVKFVSEFHGYSMLGLKGSKIQLDDPAKAETIPLSPADFRHDFLAILFRK